MIWVPGWVCIAAQAEKIFGFRLVNFLKFKNDHLDQFLRQPILLFGEEMGNET